MRIGCNSILNARTTLDTMRRHRSAALATAAIVLLAGGSVTTASTTAPGTAPRLVVATTVAPITSIVANIVGDRADVTGIVPEGTNSHTFEPRPSVAELLSKADVVYVNGLQLEDPTVELAESNLHDGAEIVELGTQTITPDRMLGRTIATLRFFVWGTIPLGSMLGLSLIHI